MSKNFYIQFREEHSYIAEFIFENALIKHTSAEYPYLHVEIE